MKKLIVSTIPKHILIECREVSLTYKYTTSVMSIYEEVRNLLSINSSGSTLYNLRIPTSLLVSIFVHEQG